MIGYIKKNALTIGRVFAAYEPLKFFGAVSFLLLGGAVLASLPFVVDWIRTGDTSGHLQSIILAAALGIASVQLLALAVVADLIASQRIVTQRTLERVRRLELHAEVEPSHYDPSVERDRRVADRRQSGI
jgi:hypothetical protein